MFKNYLISSLRFFSRNKGYSLINILGLSIGLTVSITGFLYVINELSYDKFNVNAGRIYRIAVDALAGNTAIYQTYTPAVMAGMLYNEFPEIDKVTRIATFDDELLKAGENVFLEDNIFITDSTFFEMFTIPVVKGETGKLLNQPFTAVLTESAAVKYFGAENPVNQIIRRDTMSFKVIAVVKDIPENSHFHFNIALSLISFDGFYNNPQWFANNFRTYFLLKPNTDPQQVAARLPDFTDKYLFNGNYSKATQKGNKWELYLQPLTSIHLNSELRGEFEPNGRKEYVFIFLVVSVFILLIACFNFINLSTAKSAARAREVGLRKTVGAGRQDLFWQFMGESLLTSYISLAVALFFVELTTHFLRQWEGIRLSMPYLTNVFTIPVLLLFGLIVGLLSGIYPAMVLSSFKPVFALKKQLVKSSSTPWLRNVLVTFQFATSVILIIGTFVIYKQLELLQNSGLGFDKERIITIDNASVISGKIESLKSDLKALPFVEEVSAVWNMPGEHFPNLGFGAEDFEGGYTLNLTAGDEDLDKVLKFEIIKGRYFSKEFGTDSTGIIINESALKLLGYDDPIGKKLNTWSDPPKVFHITGVVKDLCYESKHQKVMPMGIVNIDGPFGLQPGSVAVRVSPGDYREMLSGIESIWDEYSPAVPFKYSFFEKDYDNLYINEMQTRKLFLAFSFLAVFIACLGLLGLASFLLQQKTKEIGVRKAFGASTISISLLFSRNFTKWVLLANLIAWPVAWYFFDNWLNNFAYRTGLSWWFFVLAGIVSLAIALVTVSYQTVRAASGKPVEALRYE